MTTKEKVHQQFLLVMQQIDEALNSNKQTSRIFYKFLIVPADDSLSSERQKSLLNQLQESGALEISKYDADGAWLEINKPRFYRVYRFHNIDDDKAKSLEDSEFARTRNAWQPIEGLFVEEAITYQEKSLPETVTTELTDKHNSEKTKFICNRLVVDFDEATLKYANKQTISISPTTDEIKILKILLQKQPNVVQYWEIAHVCGLLKQEDIEKTKSEIIPDHELEDINKSYARSIQFIRRDLGNVLVAAGMTHADITTLIKAVTNVGYRLHLS